MDHFELQRDQEGLVTRHQVLSSGGTRHDIARLIRQRLLVPVHRGVYIDHTGPISWRQHLWAAYLACPAAAVADESVLALTGLLPEELPIHLAVPHDHRVAAPAGTVLHRTRNFEQQCLEYIEPRRLKLEVALIRVAGRKSNPAQALGLLTDAVRSRRTTVGRVVETIEASPRIPHRGFLLAGLSDVAIGVHSRLEHDYLQNVERAHRLPTGTRQTRHLVGSVIYRDVEYDDQGVVVELDGAVGHSQPADRWRDMDRDLRSAAQGLLTLRIGWHHVDRAPCRTAALVAEALRSRGWPGQPSPCGPTCPVTEIGEG